MDIAREVVRRAVDGDKAALEQILRACSGPFVNLASRMGLTRDAAEDAAQECLVRIATRLAQYDGTAKFSTWAWRVATRRILDMKAVEQRITFARHASGLADGLDLQATENPHDSVELGELKMRCDWALLKCLDAAHRVAFILGAIFEVNGEEAAAILEIASATFRKRLQRARNDLTNALTSNCGLVNPSAPCRCHRRLTEARELKRVTPGVVTTERPLDIVALRQQLAHVRTAIADTYYRADPPIQPQRDVVRAALEPLNQ